MNTSQIQGGHRAAIPIALGVLLFLASTAHAHDTWIRPLKPLAKVGQPISLEGTSGMKFPDLESPIAPDRIQVVAGLPKTRSGKIMRRILRKIASGEYEELGDISTLADPSVVEKLVDDHRRQST